MTRRAGPRLVRPLADFLRTEAAGGAVLVAAALIALVWANSPWSASYEDTWSTDLAIGVGSWQLDLTLREWINDGAMVLFFFVVGLEIKRELVEGELRDPRRAALPAIAAAGGMLVPALLYLAIVAGSDATSGWGIPMATDIALAVGVMSVLGARVSSSLKLFLLALAIVDDIGAILVIAIFYSQGIRAGALALALVAFTLAVVVRVARVPWMWVYVVLGAVTWIALHESGVHATLVGVAFGLLTPTRPIRPGSAPVLDRLEHTLHPWTSFVVVPVFALANAGIPVGVDAIDDALGARVTYGVFLGLVIGKFVGIALFTGLAVRAHIGVLPDGAGWREVFGVAALGGIGFTVSIFVAGLAFDDPVLEDRAKVGVLAASLCAGALGALLLSGSRGAQPRLTERSPVTE